MKVEGTFVFAEASADDVWNSLTCPESIAECLPGCEKLEKIGEDAYLMNIRVGIGAIRSSYSGTIQLSDFTAPSGYSLKVSGTGGGGFMEGFGTVQLLQNGPSVEVNYSGNVSIGGKIAAIGQRMVGGAARLVIDQFFKAMAKRFTEKAEARSPDKP